MSKPVLCALLIACVALPAVASPAPTPDLAALFSVRACSAAAADSGAAPTPVLTLNCGTCSVSVCNGRNNGDFCGWFGGQKEYCTAETPCSGGGARCVCSLP